MRTFKGSILKGSREKVPEEKAFKMPGELREKASKKAKEGNSKKKPGKVPVEIARISQQ